MITWDGRGVTLERHADHLERVVVHRGVNEGDVDGLLAQQRADRVFADFHGFDAHVRVAFLKLAKQARGGSLARVLLEQYADAERALDRAAHESHVVDTLLEVFQDAVGDLEQGVSGGGELHAAFRAFEQLHAEVDLELRDLVAQRGLGDEHAFSGSSEVQFFGERSEVAQLARLEGHTARPFIATGYQSPREKHWTRAVALIHNLVTRRHISTSRREEAFMSSIAYLVDRAQHDWWRFTPALIELARQCRMPVYVLSIVGNMGTGLFSSNLPAADDAPTLKAHDTRGFEARHREQLQAITWTLQAAGIRVSSAWKPELSEIELLEDLANRDVRVFARPSFGWLERLFHLQSIRHLEGRGIRVVHVPADAPNLRVEPASA
jgi:hypothetical protein